MASSLSFILSGRHILILHRDHPFEVIVIGFALRGAELKVLNLDFQIASRVSVFVRIGVTADHADNTDLFALGTMFCDHVSQSPPCRTAEEGRWFVLLAVDRNREVADIDRACRCVDCPCLRIAGKVSDDC